LRLVHNESIEAYVLHARKETRMFVWLKRNPDPEFEAMASRLEQLLCGKWLRQRSGGVEVIDSGPR
jgi:hypothetical protein